MVIKVSCRARGGTSSTWLLSGVVWQHWSHSSSLGAKALPSSTFCDVTTSCERSRDERTPILWRSMEKEKSDWPFYWSLWNRRVRPNGKWVFDTILIGFSTSGSCWELCPKANRLGCRWLNWVLYFNKIILAAHRILTFSWKELFYVMKSLGLHWYRCREDASSGP